MQKEFNITGTCFPEDHFMVDISEKLKQVMKMIDAGKYFLINRPRQYGKTTMLETLEQHLLKQTNYLPIRLNFEELGQTAFSTEEALCTSFLKEIAHYLEDDFSDLAQYLFDKIPITSRLEDLSRVLTRLIKQKNVKWVLLIDEVDKSSNYKLFIEFLGMLRGKYLARKRHQTFHNVILVGVHDVKNLKSKIRTQEQASISENSPWNIASSFNITMSFLPNEIQTMLADYIADTGVKMNQELIAQTIYDYTSGYPFLVSHICKIIDEQILPNKTIKSWAKKDVETAIQQLIKRSNTNFESMMHKIKKHPKLKQLLFNMLMNQRKISFNYHNSLINIGLTYGIFKKEKEQLQIHNKIYQQLIYNYLISTIETDLAYQGGQYNTSSDFFLPTGGLNMKKIFRRFQLFMKEQYNVKQDQIFLETNGRLLFMAFIRPIINGQGHMFREAQISEEKRLDLVITYNEFTYIIELKRWAGEKRHQEGIKQLVNYLDYKNVAEGYLLIFDFRVRNRAYKEVEQTYQQKKLFITWV